MNNLMAVEKYEENMNDEQLVAGVTIISQKDYDRLFIYPIFLLDILDHYCPVIS